MFVKLNWTSLKSPKVLILTFMLGATLVTLTGAIFLFRTFSSGESPLKGSSKIAGEVIREVLAISLDEEKMNGFLKFERHLSAALKADTDRNYEKGHDEWAEAVNEAKKALGDKSIIATFASYSQGEFEYSFSRYDLAVAPLRKALDGLADYPNESITFSVRERLSNLLQISKKFDQALPLLTANLDAADVLDKETGEGTVDYKIRALDDLITYHYRMNKYDLVDSVYDQELAAVNSLPDAKKMSISVLRKKAETYEYVDPAKAESAYQAAIGQDPSMVENRRRFAMFLRNSGKLDRALEQFNKVIALDPKNDLAFDGRGQTYILKGQLENGIADATISIELEPANPHHYETRARAYAAKKDYERAISDLSDSYKRQADITVLARRAALYVECGKYQEALADYDKAMSSFPPPNCVIERAAVYQKLGQYDKAVADYSKRIELERKNPLLAYGQLHAAPHPEYAKRPALAAELDMRASAYEGLKQKDLAKKDRDEAQRIDAVGLPKKDKAFR